MWGCAYAACSAMNIPIHKFTGAFWEQGMQRGLEELLAQGADYILTLDYDTVFSPQDLQTLILLAERHPEADAIAALQVHRSQPTALMTVVDADGNPLHRLPADALRGDLTEAATAHFGCTLIRTAALEGLGRPWFHGQPDLDGRWSDARTDPDIAFWRRWRDEGRSLFVANRVPVGHLEVMIRWPGRALAATWQHPNDYHASGKPEDCWQ
jgi:hypothetical protein